LCVAGWCSGLCAGSRGLVVLDCTLASANWLFWALRWHPRIGCSGLCAGIRALLACFTRCPCAGRHLLFFAAAKKSRQKKAAHTASPCSCLRAPKGSYASHGNHIILARCQRSCRAPHPLHAPAFQHAVPDSPPPPRWQTVCRPSVLHTLHSRPIAHAPHPVRAPGHTTRQPTHSLPLGRHIPFAAA
jgi:hypothetical protein